MVGKVKMAMITMIPISNAYKGSIFMLFSFQEKVTCEKTHKQHRKAEKGNRPTERLFGNELAEYQSAYGDITGIKHLLRINLTMALVQFCHVKKYNLKFEESQLVIFLTELFGPFTNESSMN
jgi:hypothetical protein